MSISAKDVAKLRQLTGAGMMDCKKALVEAEGDFEKAEDILRKKGQKVSAKRADRDAKEGIVFVKLNDAGNEATLLELNCETDFVAKNQDFQDLGNRLINAAQAAKPADLESFKALDLDGRPVSDHLIDAIGKIGEKIDVSKLEVVKGDSVVTYVHPGARIGVAVAFNNVNGGEVSQVGKDVAMQITAMSPISIDKDNVPESVIEKELEIGREQARAQGKPEQIIEKIATGKLNKYFRENTLLNQDFVKDTSKNVRQYVKETLGPDAVVAEFKRVQLGAS